MRKKEKELYKNSPEALAFIEAHPELFEDITTSVSIKLPTEKDLDWINNIQVLWGRTSREVMLDVSAGYSNEEIMKKYGFKNLHSVESYISKTKKQIKETIKKRKKTNQRNRRSISDLETVFSQKTFTFNGEDKTVYLVKVSADYALNFDNFLPENAEALYLRGEVLENVMPRNVKRLWDYFKEEQPTIDFLFEKHALNSFLSKFRWVDEDGVSFKIEVDVQISVAEETDFSDL